MSNNRIENGWLKESLSLVILIITCLLILNWMLRLKSADLSVPFSYGGGDVFIYSMFMKGAMEGWPLHINLLGAPTELNLADFPINDTSSLLLIKFLALFTKNFPKIFNLFFLINYPLTAVITYGVLRQFKIRYAASIVGSLLYAFLPYHFSRAIGHCFYAVYYAVPLMVMILLWVSSGRLTVTDLFSWQNLRQNKWRWLVCLLTCFLVSTTGGFYYAFFALVLLCSTALLMFFRQPHWPSLLTPCALIGLILFSLIGNVLPNLLYIAKNGKIKVASREPLESDLFGLKISSLLLPVQNHLIPIFAETKLQANKYPLSTENGDSTLGIIGSIGFLTLIGWLLYRKRDGVVDEEPSSTFATITNLSVFNLTAILLSTIGGFGSIFALLVWSQIRGYNRISVYIAFFSLLTVFLLLEYFANRYLTQRWQIIAYHFLLIGLLCLGILDQAGNNTLEYSGPTAQYLNDNNFVKKIESQVAENAMIFQLPYRPFPESGPHNQMMDYDHFRGYLNSSHLRWSYGNMRGRKGDQWLQEVSSKPIAEMAQQIVKAGFSGVYIDRFGFEDTGANLEMELNKLTETPPIISQNGRLVFYDLTSYSRKILEKLSPAELIAQNKEALNVLTVEWGSGFYDLETLKEESWRWSQPTGQIKIINGSDKEKRVTLEMEFSTEHPGSLEIVSPFFNEKLHVSPTRTSFFKTIPVPPGEHVITFHCDAARSDANDPRILVFRINNFKWKQVD